MPEDPEHMDVEQLTTHYVRRAVTGDQDSLSWVVSRFSPPLMAAARRHLGWDNRARMVEPEELVQETWVVALPRLVDVQPQGNRVTPVLLSFLVNILWRQHHSMLRRALRSTAGRGDCDSLPDSTRGAISRMIQSETTEKLYGALDQLSEDARNIVIMRGLERVRTKEVAQLLGISADAVSSRYLRALKVLRTLITDPIVEEILTEPNPSKS